MNDDLPRKDTPADSRQDFAESGTDFETIRKKRAFLANIVEEATGRYRRKHKAYYIWAFITRFATVIVSAAVAGLLAVDLDPSPIVRNLALAGAGFTGVVNGLATFFDFGSLAACYNVTAKKLDVLRSQIDYLETGGEPYTLQAVNDLRDRYLEILAEVAAFFLKVKQDEM